MGGGKDGQAPSKHVFGPMWQPFLRSLPWFKRLRGTWMDPFGYTSDRRLDRALLNEYRDRLELVLRTLRASNLARSIEIASVPDTIKGYGHVRIKSVEAARLTWQQLQPQG